MMNVNAAFRCTASRAVAAVVPRRGMSTTPSTAFLAKRDSWSFRKNWLSDQATYPLFFVMGCAGCLVVGTITACLSYSPDVRISKSKRSSIVRTWGFSF